MHSDFNHVTGRTVSPCLGCTRRQPGYACLRTCNLPGRYSMSLGTMGGSVPPSMTPQGRLLTFTHSPAPGYSPVHSGTRGRGASSGEPRTYGRRRIKRDAWQRCHFPGCGYEGRRVYCPQHHRVVYARVVILRWPAILAYAPTGGGRKILPELVQKERAGLLNGIFWYEAARRDHADGLLEFATYGKE